ncbi:MAG: Dyp-type peroxidase [Acidimicrobiales bacterium]
MGWPELASRLQEFPGRWQVGFGSAFFDAAHLGRPQALTPLYLNGDDRFAIDPNDQATAVVAFGGTWGDSIAAMRSVRELFTRDGSAIVTMHLGVHVERDHTGFLDGTSNLQDLDAESFRACTLVQPDEDPAFSGGSYLIFRKYEEDLHLWEDLPDAVKETIIGRRRCSGAFLDGSFEWTPNAWGVTHPRAHVRRANPRADTADWRNRLFRRGVSYTERADDGALRHGLLFFALARDPVRQFVRIHNEALVPDEASGDLLFASGYVKPRRSGCFFLPRPSQVRDVFESGEDG